MNIFFISVFEADTFSTLREGLLENGELASRIAE
jgi:hypothetical protein